MPLGPVWSPAPANQGLLVLAEPPSLGQLPGSPKGRVLAYATALFGGLLATGAVLCIAPAINAVPARVVTVALAEFEDQGVPPPPPAMAEAAPAGRPASPNAPIEPIPSNPVIPTMSQVVPNNPLASASGGQANGQVGGQVGGMAGGVAGGVAGGQAGGQVGNPDAVAPPRFDAAYLQNPEPSYPTLSKRFGEEGRVILRVLVTPEGLADQVEIRQSSGHARLDQAALGTVKRWRFTPARRGAERLAAWVLVPLSFQLDA